MASITVPHNRSIAMKHQVVTDDGIIEVVVTQDDIVESPTGEVASPKGGNRRQFFKKVGKAALGIGTFLALGRVSTKEALALAPGDCGYCVERTACGSCTHLGRRGKYEYRYKYYDAQRGRCDVRCSGWCTILGC
jgi:hypothetical protein